MIPLLDEHLDRKEELTPEILEVLANRWLNLVPLNEHDCAILANGRV
jgi:hypothetical protein